ncbi:MAG: hypothetical protein RBR08_07690 [Desulforegulaceae bacterium]|nr:hypothetical protein [Desulforegulaceae bacterium]
MKNILIIICMFFCLQTIGFCNERLVEVEKETPLTVLLNKLDEQGYKIIAGPVQLLEKTKTELLFYRQKPVPYKNIRTIDVMENFKIIQKYDFVHILSNNGNIVLIYSEREKRDDI